MCVVWFWKVLRAGFGPTGSKKAGLEYISVEVKGKERKMAHWHAPVLLLLLLLVTIPHIKSVKKIIRAAEVLY